MIRKRIVSAALAVLLAASSLTGMASCRKKDAAPAKEKRTNVYAGEEIALPSDIEYINRVATAGNKTYITYSAAYSVTYNDAGEEVERTAGYNWEENEKKQETLPEGWWIAYEDQNMLCTVDVDTKTTTSAPFNYDEEQYGYINSGLFGTSDGKLVGISTKWEYNEDYTESQNTFYLVTIDPASAEVTGTVALNDAMQKGGMDPANTWISSLTSHGDEIWISSEMALFSVDLNGNYKSKLDLNLSDGWINNVAFCGDRLFVGYYEGGPKLKYYENGEFVTVPQDLIGSNSSFMACDDENVYFSSSTGISAYNADKGTYGEVLNYINSDIMDSGTTAFLPDGRIVIAVTDWSGEKSVTTLSVYHRIPDEELAEEIILRLGCLYVDYNLKKSIIKFNKQNTGVRVTVVDYSTYNNESNEYTGAQTQFNADLATGKVPDMVLLNSQLPVETYFRKNIFLDLNPFIDDAEKGVSRADLESNILAADDTNGKLYSLILTYSINTLLAKSDKVGKDAGWTFEDMMKAIKAMPEDGRAFYESSRDNIVDSFFNYSMDSFINWDTGETYFETPGFIEFVNYLKTCPEKSYWDERYGEGYEYDPDIDRQYEEEYSLRFYRDKALFNQAYFSSFVDYLWALNQFATKEVTAIGYPRQGEGNGAVIVPSIEIAVSAKSAAKNEAWEVLKFFLNDSELMEPGYQFSISRKAMDNLAAKAKEDYGDYEASDDEYDWMRESGYSEEYIDFQKNSRQKFDQAAVDYIRGIVENASRIARTDSSLVDIVKEDLSAVFAGAKSAEEAAKQIASRVGIYVAEHS